MISLAQLAIPGCESRWRGITRDVARDAFDIVEAAWLGPFEDLSVSSRDFFTDLVQDFAEMLLCSDRMTDDELQYEIDELVKRRTVLDDFEFIDIVRDYHLYRGGIVFRSPAQDGVYQWHPILLAAAMTLAREVIRVLLEEFTHRLEEDNARSSSEQPDDTTKKLAHRLEVALGDCLTARAESAAIEAASWILTRTKRRGGDLAYVLLVDGRSLEESTAAAIACLSEQ